MTCRAKKTATMSDKTLTPKKKYTHSCAVTCPPRLRFQAVSATTPAEATPEKPGKSHRKRTIRTHLCRVTAITERLRPIPHPRNWAQTLLKRVQYGLRRTGPIDDFVHHAHTAARRPRSSASAIPRSNTGSWPDVSAPSRLRADTIAFPSTPSMSSCPMPLPAPGRPASADATSCSEPSSRSPSKDCSPRSCSPSEPSASPPSSPPTARANWTSNPARKPLPSSRPPKS